MGEEGRGLARSLRRMESQKNKVRKTCFLIIFGTEIEIIEFKQAYSFIVIFTLRHDYIQLKRNSFIIRDSITEKNGRERDGDPEIEHERKFELFPQRYIIMYKKLTHSFLNKRMMKYLQSCNF